MTFSVPSHAGTCVLTSERNPEVTIRLTSSRVGNGEGTLYYKDEPHYKMRFWTFEGFGGQQYELWPLEADFLG